MARLNAAETQTALLALPGWSAEGDALVKTYRFSTFPDGIAFVSRVADVAEELAHHPDVDIRYTRIILRLSTHSEGGITAKDITLAQRIEALLSR